MNIKLDKLFDDYKEVQKELFFSSYEEGALRIKNIQNELLSLSFEFVVKHPQVREIIFMLENSLLEIAIYHKQSDDVLLRHYRNLIKMSSCYDVESLCMTSLNLADEFFRRGNDKAANRILKKVSHKTKDLVNFCNSINIDRK
ncbi:MAG: hypothetical protein IKS45_06870 [Thermoguttaceae bacterium]|nr:hypothetical protein [Thermoguttaceae bacterium]